MTKELPDRQTVGILGYGSLITDPGSEIKKACIDTIKDVVTPFHVEFARSSTGRGGAPTLVPVTNGGARVNGQVFVMDRTEQEATNVLYRREIGKVGTDCTYAQPGVITKNTVLVKKLPNFTGLDIVLYTHIADTIDPLTAENLAVLAIKSAGETDPERDGITYLINAKQHGIVTPLSPAYEAEILRRTECGTLEEALAKLSKTAGQAG